tara:strand:+ start:1735 stop:2700 length:966 start_codon:yes stop_codon:yes gene_type:complete
MKTIAIITGGNSAEHKISLQSAKVVKSNLNKQKYNAILVHIKDGLWEVIYKNKRTEINKKDFSFTFENRNYYFDLAFMALHGPPAENGIIQSYLDKIGLPYTSCGAKESALTFDKNKCNETLKRMGFTCAISFFYTKGESINTSEIIQKVGLPCFVKPNSGGSSFGVSKIRKESELRLAIDEALKHDSEVLIEQFIEGVEVSCGIFKNKKIEVFPVTEIVSHNEFFDYKAKYQGFSDEITPARISTQETHKIKETTKEIYQKLSLKGIVRIDYIIMQGIPYIIEINSIPGLSEESIIPKQAKQAGYKLSELFEITIKNILN